LKDLNNDSSLHKGFATVNLYGVSTAPR